MPYQEKEIEKLYYTISEVAERFDVNASLIRFWEKEFDVLKPKKNKKGNRLFTKEDIKNLALIYQLVKVEGYTLQGAKDKLKAKPASAKTDTQSVEPKSAPETQKVVHKLEQIKAELIDLQHIIAKSPPEPIKTAPKVQEPKKDLAPPSDISPNQISLFD